jgi:four helix bundle protein
LGIGNWELGIGNWELGIKQITMAFDKRQLIARFKNWCYNTLNIIASSNKSYEQRNIRNQLTRSCMSSYANYSAACRAKSRADFIYKLKVVEEELDESILWLDMLIERHSKTELEKQITEAGELLRIIVSSIKTIRKP